MSNGDIVSFINSPGTLPTELRKDVFYFVVNRTVDSFQVAYTIIGPALEFTDAGSGLNVFSPASIHGQTTRLPIADNSPRDLIPQGLATITPYKKIALLVLNLSDSGDIDVRNLYYRITKI